MTKSQPSSSPKKGPFRLMVEIGFLIIFCFGVIVFVIEHISYQDLLTCRSEHLYFIKERLHTYLKTHGGNLGRNPLALKSLIEQSLPSPKILECQKNRKLFQWFPKKEASHGNIKLIVMCPHHPHGWIRKFSWAVGLKNNQLSWFRIRKNGKIIKDQMK